MNNKTPASGRTHIGIFGRRNSGKSSLINAITGQESAIVSEVLGTTTDPVYKAMEILPLGPVTLIDTPGLDDGGVLGSKRVKKAYEALRKCDIALVVCDAADGVTEVEKKIEQECKAREIPYILLMNKSDLTGDDTKGLPYISAKSGQNIHQLKERLGTLNGAAEKKLIADLLPPDALVVMVTPIDASAPKGRIILPQQQTLRELLDANAAVVVVQPPQLKQTLKRLGNKPQLVITDSQAFEETAEIVSGDIPLTSFSILFARKKGILEIALEGAREIGHLKNDDRVLICEGCTHHRQCEDIGTVKLPRWLEAHTKKQLSFDFVSGADFPEDLSPYRLIIHCGGCMLNDREISYRYKAAREQRVAITNYGTAIAHLKGILERSAAFLKER